MNCGGCLRTMPKRVGCVRLSFYSWAVEYHEDSYWTTKRVTEETFAHMFEAQFSAERYAEMKKYFPKSLKKFEEMLGSVVI